MSTNNPISFNWDNQTGNNMPENSFPDGSTFPKNNWKFLKSNSQEIEKLFSGNNRLQYNDSLTLVQEPGCSCNIDPKEITVYRPKNKTPGYQAGEDEYLFKIKIFTSTRGELIKQAYFECKENEDEALFFIEHNTGDVSKAKIYAKFGAKVLKETLLNISTESSSESLLKKYTGLSDDILKELIQNGVYEEKSSIIRSFVTGFYKFLSYIGLPMKALGWVCEKLGEVIIEYLALSESVWNSRGPDYFLKRENVLAALLIDPKITDSIRKSLEDDPASFEFNDLIPDFIINNINLGLTVVDGLIKKYNSYVTTTINDFYDEYETAAIVSNIQFNITEKIAFICGIWNGVVDFVGGLLIFIGQIAQIQYNVGSNLEDYLERFDSFCETISNLNWDEISKAFSAIYNEISNYLKDDTENDYNYDKIAYFTGFVVAFIGTMFIPFTAFAKPLGVINKFKKAVVPTELIEKVSQATSKTSNFVVKAGKEASEAALKFIDDIVALLAKGVKGIEEFLRNIWKTIAEWFVENKKIVTLVDKVDESLSSLIKILRKNLDYLDSIQYIKSIRRPLGKWIALEQEAAINLYTKSYYIKFNKALRKLGVTLTKEHKAMQKVLDDALSKLPSYEQKGNPLLRSAFFGEKDIKKLFQVGKDFIDKGFFSTTHSEAALFQWMKNAPTHNVIFKVYGKNGKLIELASDIRTEAEVLFRSGTNFLVQSVEKGYNYKLGREITEIILKEK